ncbi:MAG: ATP-dependent RecD-like DNA helicase [Fidelibacterota bacterium]
MSSPTKKQQSVIKMVQGNQISILSGGPGVGKSFTANLIVQWAKKNKLIVLQAAPTGKAAKRMIEATNHYASTIHTMLGCEFDNDKFVFIHNSSNQLFADLIILDETSMINNDLMASVMDAIDTKKTKLLLIGDQNQLPSVGAGAVLRDLLSSKVVPHIELDEIFRNSGSIVECCHRVKNGQSYFPADKLDLKAENPVNLIHIECCSPEKTLAGIKKIVCDRMPLRGYDPINDIQVISPVNTKGLLSCESINDVLRDQLNPPPFPLNQEDKKQFRTGDKIINTQNTPVISTDNKKTAIVNGDIGIIQEIKEKNMSILFSNPDREVLLSKTDKTLLFAYCITCHRFQGSESPVIIIPVHTQFNYFISNPWIYTALSRGKEIVITIGAFDTIQKAILNKQPNDRETRLSERIVEEYNRQLNIEFGGI